MLHGSPSELKPYTTTRWADTTATETKQTKRRPEEDLEAPPLKAELGVVLVCQRGCTGRLLVPGCFFAPGVLGFLGV